MVDVDEVAVLIQRLLIGINAVDVFGRVVVICVRVQDTFERQSVCLFRHLIGPSYSNRGDGEYQLWKAEHVNDTLWLINRSTQVARAQSFGFGQCREGLRHQ